MKIVKPRSIETLEVKVLTFHNKGLTENRDFSFPCDDNGNINTKDSNYRLWKENYERCLSEAKKGNMTDGVVSAHTYTYVEPAVGICDECGHTIVLDNEYAYSCKCKHCGTWYNLLNKSFLPETDVPKVTEETEVALA